MLLSVLMPTEQIVALLIAERDKLIRAIEVLQGQKRRGRPPKSALATERAAPPARRTRRRTAAQRKAQSERMKAHWAKRKGSKTDKGKA